VFDILGLLVVVHVAANVVWIGAILSVGVALCTTSVPAVDRSKVALRLYRRLATPAFLVSVTAGLLRLLGHLELYFNVTRYMHAKLLLAVCVIALHHILGARAKAASAGRAIAPGSAKTLSSLLLLAATLAVFFAVRKPF
jgi:putative membrane protein